MSDSIESPGRSTRQKSQKESNGTPPPPNSSKKGSVKGKSKKPAVPPKPKLGLKTPSKNNPGGKKAQTKLNPKSSELPNASDTMEKSVSEVSFKEPNSDTLVVKEEPESMLDAILNSEDSSDDMKEPNLPEISIPDAIRKEAGQHWRLKEAILASYHYGRATIFAADFARSNSESKTAAVIADSKHSWDSKKHHVKLHLANYQKWVRSATMCTSRLRGKRKMVVLSDSNESKIKARRTSEHQSTPPIYCDVLSGKTYSTFVQEQTNLENMRWV